MKISNSVFQTYLVIDLQDIPNFLVSVSSSDTILDIQIKGVKESEILADFNNAEILVEQLLDVSNALNVIIAPTSTAQDIRNRLVFPILKNFIGFFVSLNLFTLQASLDPGDRIGFQLDARHEIGKLANDLNAIQMGNVLDLVLGIDQATLKLNSDPIHPVEDHDNVKQLVRLLNVQVGKFKVAKFFHGSTRIKFQDSRSVINHAA